MDSTNAEQGLYKTWVILTYMFVKKPNVVSNLKFIFLNGALYSGLQSSIFQVHTFFKSSITSELQATVASDPESSMYRQMKFECKQKDYSPFITGQLGDSHHNLYFWCRNWNQHENLAKFWSKLDINVMNPCFEIVQVQLIQLELETYPEKCI